MVVINQPLDKGDHLRDEVRWTRHPLWELIGIKNHAKPQSLGILQEPIRKIVGDGVRVVGVNFDTFRQRTRLLGFFQSNRRNFHLVLPPAIRRTVFGHVSDISHVHDVDDFMTKEFKGAPQKIRIQK